MIDHLERVSLVEFNNLAGIERLSKAIESANKLHMVNTDGVEPMESVLEDRYLHSKKKINYSETCLNQTLNNPKTCLNQTLNNPKTCLNQTLNNS